MQKYQLWEKRKKSCLFDNSLKGHAKQYKSEAERQIPDYLTHFKGTEKQSKKKTLGKGKQTTPWIMIPKQNIRELGKRELGWLSPKKENNYRGI